MAGASRTASDEAWSGWPDLVRNPPCASPASNAVAVSDGFPVRAEPLVSRAAESAAAAWPPGTPDALAVPAGASWEVIPSRTVACPWSNHAGVRATVPDTVAPAIPSKAVTAATNGCEVPGATTSTTLALRSWPDTNVLAVATTKASPAETRALRVLTVAADGAVLVGAGLSIAELTLTDSGPAPSTTPAARASRIAPSDTR